MHIRTTVLLAALGACSQQPEEQQRQSAAPAPVVAPEPPAATPMASVQQAAMIDLPKDPAQLKRLETMGYTVHTDHLHAPGVSVCPKMSGDPIM